MEDHEQRAIVIGGSLAGLLAARVLSERYAKVTVLECEPSLRVHPQHAHGLLAGGLVAYDALFPGIAEQARARGARVVDVGSFAPWTIEGVALPSMETGLHGLLIGHHELEQLLRERITSFANVELRHGARVSDLLGSPWKVTGVRLDGGEQLEAKLVVDASGRTSHVPSMLRHLGLKPPHEERVRVELRCTSCVIRRKPHHLEGREGFVYTPSAPTPRGASVLALDDERYLVTLFGYLGARAAPSYRAMVEFARGLPERTLAMLLSDSEPISEPVEMRHPGSVRHRYDRMRHRPRGLLAIGDALCSMNPAYGHGSTLAAMQAHALRRALESRDDERALQQRYFSEATRIVDIPWSTVAGADLEFHGARSTQPPPHPSIRTYFKRALHAAGRDAAVALAVYRVMHLIDPPSALFAPALVSVVLGQREVHHAAAPCLKLVPDRS